MAERQTCTDDDGYIEPEWTVPLLPDWSWEGGRGDWSYTGRRAVDDDPPRLFVSNRQT